MVNIVSKVFWWFWTLNLDYYPVVLFNRVGNYYLNNALTMELNPSRFLDTKLTNINGFYKFNVCQESTKLQSPRSSGNSKRNKRNTVNGALQSSKRIPLNFNKEITVITGKYMKVYCSWQLRFEKKAKKLYQASSCV